jgi:hypothetical protein
LFLFVRTKFSRGEKGYMNEIGNSQHTLSINQTVARARAHLTENEKVILRLSIVAHERKLKGRVNARVMKMGEVNIHAESTAGSEGVRVAIQRVLSEVVREIKAYHKRRSFGTVVAVIARQGSHVFHVETEYDERVLDWAGNSGGGRCRIKQS